MARKMIGTASNFKITNLKQNNQIFETDDEKSNLLAETFAQISSNSNYTPTFLLNKTKFDTEHKQDYTDNTNNTADNKDFNKLFTLHELKTAIKQCKKDTQPGPDDITYEMITNLPTEALQVLYTHYNNIWQIGAVPNNWKHSIVLPIHKQDKNASDPKSYRPISLTSCLCKVMERLVTNRLSWYLESKSILNPAQTGFRQGKSTIDQILKLQDTISNYNANGGYTVGAFLDFEKAFDMLYINGLMYKLKNIGIVGNMFSFIDSFVRDRTFQVRVGSSKSDIKNLENGTPQGSVISPILFLIMINDIKVKAGVELSLFADDSATFKSGKHLDSLVKDVQESLDLISDWCEKWGVKISLTKSCAVIFSKRLKIKINKPLNIYGTPINIEKSTKFLGLIFDSKLTWAEHIDYIRKNVKKD